jgi:hypothetical protein
MGIANYSRVYIPKYAELTHALYSLMKVKDVPPSKRKKSNGAVNGKKIILEWTDEANEALLNKKNLHPRL